MNTISLTRSLSVRRAVFVGIFAAIFAIPVRAGELIFKYTACELKIDNGKSVEISVVNSRPPESLGDGRANAILSHLVVTYNFTAKTNEWETATYETVISKNDEDAIRKYNFSDGLSLFGGSVGSVVQDGGWKVSFRESLRESNGSHQTSRVSMTRDEYLMFIKAIQRAVRIKNEYFDFWKALANSWQKSTVVLDLSKRLERPLPRLHDKRPK